jgi:nucleoside-diphosphate-sugar epimerase
MTVLVIGANGFLGSHVTRQLVSDREDVRVMVRDGANTIGIDDLKTTRFVGDIWNNDALREAMTGVDVVYYCVVDTRGWLRDPAPLFNTNVEGTRNVLEVANDIQKDGALRRFVFTSSYVTVGRKRGRVATEDDEIVDGGETSPTNRLRGGSSATNRLRGGSSATNRLRGETSPTNRLRGETSPTNRLRGETSPTNRLRGGSSPTHRLRGETSPTHRLRGETSPTHRLRGLTPYVRSRVQAEELVLRYAREHGLPAIAMCVSTTYGGGDWGRTPHGAIIAGAAFGKLPFVMDRIELEAVGVDDAARALILAAEKGRVGERYLISEKMITNAEVARIAAEAAGMAPPGKRIPLAMSYALAAMGTAKARLRGTDEQLSLASLRLMRAEAPVDCAKARRELGWRPRPVEESIREAALFWVNLRNTKRKSKQAG